MDLLIVLFLVGFARTLLILVIIYYGIRIVTKYVLPLLVDKGLKNMQQKMQDQQRQHQQPSKPDGEVTIESDKKGSQNKSKDKGEYVDFEEVE
ncbi:MAG: DUF4834 family protein [Bacteroidetes bacterium]|nr:DUF4834 family protein [Bacteroidota bacterium]